MLRLGRQQLGIVVGFALVTLAADQASSRLHLDLLEPYFNPVRAGIVAAYAGNEPVEDVLVVGTSRVDVGLDARLVQDQLDQRFGAGQVSFYKIGVPGLGLRFTADLVAGAVAARPPKRLLIVDIDPRSFLVKGATTHERARLSVPFDLAQAEPALSWQRRIEESVGAVFAGLKKLWNLWWLLGPEAEPMIAFQRENRGERFSVEEAVARDRRLQRQYVEEGEEEVLELPEGQAWIWVRNSDPDVVGFRDLLDALQGLPCPVIFVRPPLERGYAEQWMPRALMKFETQVLPVIAEHGFPYYDLNRPPYPLSAEHYLAKHHLNRKGCEVVSRVIVDDLIAPLLRGEPVPENP